MHKMIATVAQRESVAVAEIHRHFLGHGSHHADAGNPHYDPHDPTPWYVFGIEPNERGAHEVRRVFWETLVASGALSV